MYLHVEVSGSRMLNGKSDTFLKKSYRSSFSNYDPKITLEYYSVFQLAFSSCSLTELTEIIFFEEVNEIAKATLIEYFATIEINSTIKPCILPYDKGSEKNLNNF